MRKRLGLRLAGLASAIIALCLNPAFRAQAQQSVCAVVQLQISQQATLERQAFNADLQVMNNLANAPLTNLNVQISMTDGNGNPADSLFFVKVTTLTNTNAVDGTGIVQSSTTADIQWIIIPSSGSGGTNPAGQRYGVSAQITSVSNGASQTINTFKAFINVQPQPVFTLQYALPYEVFGQEALLSPLNL